MGNFGESFAVRKIRQTFPPLKFCAIRYRIAGKFGGDNVWRIDSCKLFGEEKFGEWLSTKKIIA